MNNPFIATDSFAYVPGDNPQRNIIQRLDAISNAFYASMVSTTITIPAGVATTNNELVNFIPAGSLVTSLGIFFTENVATTAGTLAVGFGNASGDASIVASTVLNGAGDNFNINSFTSTSSKHKVEVNGNAIAFAAGSELWFGNASSLWFQTIVAAGALDTPVDVKVVMEYVATTNL
tara:strand:+ start:173 stop:703 length:531 start_codon:yes stop_codon:yes gene_type:complete